MGAINSNSVLRAVRALTMEKTPLSVRDLATATGAASLKKSPQAVKSENSQQKAEAKLEIEN
jgi:hypothetical protein